MGKNGEKWGFPGKMGKNGDFLRKNGEKRRRYGERTSKHATQRAEIAKNVFNVPF